MLSAILNCSENILYSFSITGILLILRSVKTIVYLLEQHHNVEPNEMMTIIIIAIVLILSFIISRLNCHSIGRQPITHSVKSSLKIGLSV